MFGNGYFLAFILLIAAGVVGAVALPAAPQFRSGEGPVADLWFRVPARA